MNYEQWKDEVAAHLLADGIDEASMQEAFREAEGEIEAMFRLGDTNAAGAAFVVAMIQHDLDLEIASERGKGRLESDLAVSYGISPEEAKSRWTAGAMKKIRMLGWFRGEEVEMVGSFDF